VRLWPNPPPQLDVGTFPLLNVAGVRQLAHVIVCENNNDSTGHLPLGWRIHTEAVPWDGAQLPAFPPQFVPPAAV
jgi:hypothetical protein